MGVSKAKKEKKEEAPVKQEKKVVSHSLFSDDSDTSSDDSAEELKRDSVDAKMIQATEDSDDDTDDDEEQRDEEMEVDVEEADGDDDKLDEDELDDDADNPIDSVEVFWANTQRALVSNKKVKKLEGPTRNLQTKVFKIDTEADYTEDDPLQMPPSGILVQGVPFHHRLAYPLEKRHIRRLYAHGIIYKSVKFSTSENIQLVRNWMQYARQYDINVDDAPLHMGWVKSVEKKKSRVIRDNLMNTAFHAYMCLKLIDRCAIQVRRHCYRLFNPNSNDWQMLASNTFTEVEDKKLLELIPIYENQFQKMAVILKKNRFDVQKRYDFLIDGRAPSYVNTEKAKAVSYKEFTNDLTKVFYNEIKDCIDVHPVHLIVNGEEGELARYEDSIDWMKLAKKIGVLPDQCVDRWKEIKTSIKNAYEKMGNPLAPVSKVEKEAFSLDADLNEPKLRKMKIADLQKSFQIMYELAKETEIRELFELDVRELTKRMKDAGLLFHTVYTIGSRVMRITNEILNNLRKHDILATLPSSISVLDLIEMLSYICGKMDHVKGLTVSKKTLLVLIKEFLDSKGLELDPKYIVLYEKAAE